MSWLLCILAKVSCLTSLMELLTVMSARGALHPFEEEILIIRSIFMLEASKQHILYLKRRSYLQLYCPNFTNMFWWKMSYQMFCVPHTVKIFLLYATVGDYCCGHSSVIEYCCQYWQFLLGTYHCRRLEATQYVVLKRNEIEGKLSKLPHYWRISWAAKAVAFWWIYHC